MRPLRSANSASMKRTLTGALFCLMLAILPAQANNTPATPTAEQMTEFRSADDAGRLRILMGLVKNGYHELAAGLLQDQPLEGPYGANRTLFVEGMILRARGDLNGAVEKFRAALANDPSLTLVRSELALTLAALNEDDSAKHHLQLLMAEAKDGTEAKGIRSFMDQLDARRPLQYSAYISAAPSSNINSGSTVGKIYLPDGTEVQVSDNSMAKSGIGVSIGGSAGYTHRFNNELALIAGLGLGGTLYKDKDFDSFGASQSVELRRLFDGGYLGAGIVGSESFSKDEIGLGYYSYGPRISFAKQVTDQDRLSVAATYEWRNYRDAEMNNGRAFMVDGNWTHALSSSANIGILLGYDRVTSGLDYNSYNAGSIGLSVYKELPMGITVDLLGNFRYAKFDEDFFGYSEPRRDKRWLGQVTLTKRDLNLYGFAPSLQYTYVHNGSNVVNYQFDAHTVDFKLTKDF